MESSVEEKERPVLRILIVEDDPRYTDILKEYFKYFQRFECKIVGIASNQAQALRLLENEKPDLVTMDGELGYQGQESGRDIAEMMRAKNQKVVITMLSSVELTFEGRGITKNSLAGPNNYKKLEEHIMSLFPKN